MLLHIKFLAQKIKQDRTPMSLVTGLEIWEFIEDKLWWISCSVFVIINWLQREPCCCIKVKQANKIRMIAVDSLHREIFIPLVNIVGKWELIRTCKMKCHYICQACSVVSAVLFILDHETNQQMILPLQEIGIANLYVSLYSSCTELDQHWRAI